MKRSLKAITLILSFILLCTLFTGCNELDELKDSHAVLNNDGSITYKGSNYLRIDLKPNSNFSPYVHARIRVTEPDVPVLLSQSESVYVGAVTDDGSMMSLNECHWFEDMEGNFFYCREDRYEEVTEKLESEIIPEVYCYRFIYYEENADEIPGTYILTEEQMATVDSILGTQADMRLDTTDADSFVTLYQGTEDQIFMYEKAMIFHVYDDYIVTDSENHVTHKVPEELTPVFDEIMEQQYLADASFDKAHGIAEY